MHDTVGYYDYDPEETDAKPNERPLGIAADLGAVRMFAVQVKVLWAATLKQQRDRKKGGRVSWEGR